MKTNKTDKTLHEIGESLRFFSLETVPNLIFASVALSEKRFDGAISTSFSDTKLLFENKGGVIFSYFCNESVLRILKKIVTVGQCQDDELINDLVNFLKQESHIEFIRHLDSSQSETEIKSVLAHHLFAQLVPKSTCKINDRPQHLETCFACKEKSSTGDTSLGHADVWHGWPDILVEKSTVKVNIDPVSEDEDQFRDEKDIEDSCVSQCIAQTITNAFFIVKKNPHLTDFYIPSFLATPTHVSIVMYNCKRDRLFMSEDLLFFNEITGKVNVSTFTTIWLVLNFERLFNPVPDHEFDKMHIAVSNFPDLAGKALSIYQNELSKPLIDYDNIRPVKRKYKLAPEMYALEIKYLKTITEGFRDIEHLIKQKQEAENG